MGISRAELGAEFFDRTSAQLLAQPEPQFPYAQLFMNALNVSLEVPEEIGLPGRAIGGQGAPYSTAEQDRLILANALMGELFAVRADFNGEPGHTLRFNRPVFENTVYSQEARQIGTSQTISTVPISVGSEQVPLTIKRFAGPYDTANGRVAPFSLDAFDATMGVHNLAKLVGTHMKRDFHRTIEGFLVTLADAGLAANIVYPEGMLADNDATAAGMFGMTYEQLNRTAKKMDEANLPTFSDGKRILVVTPAGKKQLKDDPQFARYAKEGRANPLLFPGWFDSIPEFHCFVSNTLTSVNNSSSVPVHRGHAFAPGVFLGGTGKAPRVAPATDDNYGEAAKVIWLAYLALGLADDRFVYQLRYTQDAG